VDGSVIGINAGGTRTVCLRADSTGRVVGEWRGAGANLQSEGDAGIERVLREGIGAVMDEATKPAAICVGMAGVDRADDFAAVRAVLTRIAPDSRLVIVNDALIALEAGAPGAAGSVLIAGTGSIAYGRDAAGRAARAGGWGYVLGDEGSGYWLGRQALRAVVRGSDGRGPRTALAPLVLAHYGLKSPTELVRQMSGHGARPAAVANLAPLVGLAADKGDEVALHLVSAAARELAAAVESVIRRLNLGHSPMLLTGGVLTGFDRLRDRVTMEIRARVPGVEPALLQAEPASGAVRLASLELTGQLRLPQYEG
jgi:N-acetylglucosamine kinase-like BadF-type ATPase